MNRGLPPDIDEPLFLNDEAAAAAAYVGVTTFDDELTAPDPDAPTEGVLERYRLIARLHAMGLTNNAIAHQLRYTASRISILLRDPFVQREVAVWRDKFISGDTLTILSTVANDAALRMLDIIRDPKATNADVLRIGTFSTEQVFGKAKQSVDVKNTTLDMFMERMAALRPATAFGRNERDVSAALPASPPSESQPPAEIDPVRDYFAQRVR